MAKGAWKSMHFNLSNRVTAGTQDNVAADRLVIYTRQLDGLRVRIIPVDKHRVYVVIPVKVPPGATVWEARSLAEDMKVCVIGCRSREFSDSILTLEVQTQEYRI
jgi:hypothetical protein